ncbi:MAG: aldolase [Betaproteobacteria bacterium]|jgi:3-dehydro-4-phosphotetronate decarboxylase|nr:aldolase [Betaproteobacteria bacterium]
MNQEAHRLREQLCEVGLSLFSRGYVHATAGNLSARLSDGSFLITPTDACLGRLDPADLAHVSEAGEWLSGGKPSKTLVLHRRIYQAARTHLPHTAAIIHTHSTHLVAASLRTPAAPVAGLCPELLPPITPYFVMKVGHVPLAPYERPGAAATADWVAQAIGQYGQAGKPIRAVMLERLGPNVWHDNPFAAMATLEELEETAKLWMLNHAQVQPLSAQHLQDLQQHFGSTW